MSKTWIAFWSILAAALAGLLIWKNHSTYREKSWNWKLTKSGFDALVIAASAFLLPALLVGWCTLWVLRPVKDSSIKATIGVFAAMTFGFASYFCMEALVICSAVSVDLITGRTGFLGRLTRLREAQ